MNVDKRFFIPVLSFFLLISYQEFAAGVPAFPGAEGFGANTIGGRGGVVAKVTNLNDSGPGSFREAVTAAGPRIVVFETSGIINLVDTINITAPYLTIAGQTSPGGVLITGRSVTVNTHDVIIQHMRFRVGSHRISDGADPGTLDSLAMIGKHWYENDCYNIMIDHCSISWGVDECCTLAGGVYNATVQWSIISEGLGNAGHPKGEHSKGLMVSQYEFDVTVSLHHNYIAHNRDRSPLIATGKGVTGGTLLVDCVNNVIYNWYHGLAGYGENITHINWVYNYSKPGLDSTANYEIAHNPNGNTPEQVIYVYGNLGTSRMSHSDSHWNIGDYWQAKPLDNAWQKATPWTVPFVTNTEASYAVAQDILSKVGATRPVRDSVDDRVIADFSAGTGNLIDNVVYPDDFPTFQDEPIPADSDNDGMADSWETARGLDTSTDDSALDDDSDEYTNIEEYLHYLAGIAEDSTPTPAEDVTPPAAPVGVTIS